jgi:hypothetical protein
VRQAAADLAAQPLRLLGFDVRGIHNLRSYRSSRRWDNPADYRLVQ